MNYNQILQYIVLWIKENHNNEITGDILQDVLVNIVEYVKDENESIDVDIQELQNQIDAISLAQGINVFEGVEDPNVVPPTETFVAGDIFIKTNTNDIFIFTGADWFKITQTGGGDFNPAEHDLDEFQNESSNPYARMEDLPTKTSDFINDGDKTSPFATLKDIYRTNVVLDYGIVNIEGTYQYDLWADRYIINNVLYTEMLTGSVTLSNPHPTLDRIDKIVIHSDGEFRVKEGVPAENPVSPQVDAQTEVEVRFILVKGGSTEPEVDVYRVYDENEGSPDEWTITDLQGSIEPDNEEYASRGTKSIKFNIDFNVSRIRFSPAEPIPFEDFSELLLDVRADDDHNMFILQINDVNIDQLVHGVRGFVADGNFHTVSFRKDEILTMFEQYGAPTDEGINEIHLWQDNNTHNYWVDNIRLVKDDSGGSPQPVVIQRTSEILINDGATGVSPYAEIDDVQDAIDEVYSKIKLPFKLIETDKTPEQHWRDVAYGDGKYVAVAQDGDYRIKVSYDGENWIYVEAPLVSFQGITYGNGLFVAVANDEGTSDKIFVSEDAFNWRPVLNTVVTFRGINYYNGIFIAYSSDNPAYPIHRSENGLNWTTHDVPADYNRSTRGMVFSNGVWLGISDANYNESRPYNGIISYDNAITWESYMMPTYPNGDRLNWNKIISAQGKIVAVASGTAHKAGLFYTEDLETWIDASPDGQDMLIESIAYGNERFVIEGWSLSSLGLPGWGKVYETFDLENWNLIYTHPNRVPSRSMTFGNGIFISVYGTFSSGTFSMGNVTSYYGRQEELFVTDNNKHFGTQSFEGDVLIDKIKAPTEQEYNVTVDDTGKLISEPKPTFGTMADEDAADYYTKTETDKNTLQSYTVATLPAAPSTGDQALVTDADSPAWNTAVTGGGATTVAVYFDGTNWICH